MQVTGIHETTKQRRYRRISIGGIQPPVRVGRNDGVLLNVSEGGLCFEGPTHGAVGEVAPVEFVLPEANEVFSVTGVVAWVNSGRTGIQFINVPPQYRQPLHAWLSDATAHFSPPAAMDEPVAGLAVFAPTMHGHIDLPPAVGSPAAQSSPYLDRDSGLDMILERIRIVTHATGAAVALWDGYGMVCCMSSGDAPDRGVRLNSSTGLSSECIATGRTVTCDDAQNDSRVDPLLRQQLKFRSALIVPVVVDGWIFGLLEVFSPQARAFSERHVRLVERLSTVAAALLSAPLKTNPDQATLDRELVDVFGRFTPPEVQSKAQDSDPVVPNDNDVPLFRSYLQKNEDHSPNDPSDETGPRATRKFNIKLPMLLMISLLLVIAAFCSGWIYGWSVRSDPQQAIAPRSVSAPSSLAQ